MALLKPYFKDFLAGGAKAKLYFVIPPYCYKTFKVQRYVYLLSTASAEHGHQCATPDIPVKSTMIELAPDIMATASPLALTAAMKSIKRLGRRKAAASKLALTVPVPPTKPETPLQPQALTASAIPQGPGLITITTASPIAMAPMPTAELEAPTELHAPVASATPQHRGPAMTVTTATPIATKLVPKAVPDWIEQWVMELDVNPLSAAMK